MTRMFILLLLLSSCAKFNYNQGSDHNSDLQNRNRVVMQQDKRMKKAVINARNKASTKKVKRVKNKRLKRYIR